MIGLGGGTLPFHAAALPYGCSVVTTLGGSTAELAEIVALAESGRLRPNIQKFKLEEVAEVYKTLEENQISGRAVLVP